MRALPDTFATTRDSLHQIAFFAMSPARYSAVGRMGLRAAPGGFGTPVFDGSVARVEGDLLVFEKASNVATRVISTVGTAAEFFGVEYVVDWFPDFHDPPDPVGPDALLDVDPATARALGEWFSFGFDLLAELATHGDAGDEVTEAQLWPEHFDVALEMGSESGGRKASYGASPGDPAHPAPYLYVSPWGEADVSDSYWNDETFEGASLGYDALVSSNDPLRAGLEFLLAGYRRLHST